MELTRSYLTVVPEDIQQRYVLQETRNAAAILQATNPEQTHDLFQVLTGFAVYDADILSPGGNRGQIAIRIDREFENLGWHAVRVNTEFKLHGTKKSHSSGHYDQNFLESTVYSEGFEVDNMKGRVAIDVEWNAKDGNLDRDLAAYRALYDGGVLDIAVIITRDHQGIQTLAQHDLESEDARRRLSTTTTTNMTKLLARLQRGDAGGCPVLAVGITRSTWAGATVPRPVEYGEEMLFEIAD